MDSEFELLPLGDSRILFLHRDNTGLHHHCAVQVAILPDESQRRNVETSVTYALAQQEISEIITKLVTRHLQDSLPEAFIIINEDWSLKASRKEWAFGKRNFRDAFLGNEQIVPSEEKWKFTFKRNLPA